MQRSQSDDAWPDVASYSVVWQNLNGLQMLSAGQLLADQAAAGHGPGDVQAVPHRICPPSPVWPTA